MAKWGAELDSSRNRQVIERSFATDKAQISTTRFEPKPVVPEATPKTDEYEEIELILRENKYRQYIARGGQKTAAETIEAIPVNFVGGYLAFYRTGHQLLSATNIIVNDADKLREEDKKLPTELKLGDFVVVRESDRDLIKEMADIILERSGKGEVRTLSNKWREALEIETLFYTPEEIYKRLQSVGCAKGYPTVRGWIMDDDVIAPYYKEDLEHIAKITGSTVLQDLLDQVHEAAQVVRNAHVQAGRALSIQLKDSDKLRNLIQEYCRVNLLDFNKIWNIYSINPNTKRWLKPLMPQGKPLNFETYCNYLGDVSIYKDYESACAFVHGQDIASKILPFTFYDSICYRFVMMMSYIFRTIRLFPLNEDMETQITNLEDGLMMLSQKYIHN